jgi:hypothetical protein
MIVSAKPLMDTIVNVGVGTRQVSRERSCAAQIIRLTCSGRGKRRIGWSADKEGVSPMRSFSLMHWIVVVLIFLTYVIPVNRIIRRTGYSGWWVLLGVIPLVNIIALRCFAFIRWPAVDEPASS